MTDAERRAYMRVYMNRYRKENREKWNAWRRKSRVRNKAHYNAENSKWRANRTHERVLEDRERAKEWRMNNPGRFKALAALNRQRLKAEVIREYGGKCECCSLQYPEFLSIDHIDGTGHLHKKELAGRNLYRWLKMNGYPKDNFRLLCMNCNFALGKIGWCPHQGMKMFVIEGGA